MGVSINLHVHNKDRLVEEIDLHVRKNGGYREGALDARSFLDTVGPQFGRVTPTEFYVVWNEYYEGYNPALEFLHVVDDYYFPNHEELGEQSEDGYWDGFWADGYSSYSHGANAGEVLSDLFPDEFGWDGEFRV